MGEARASPRRRALFLAERGRHHRSGTLRRPRGCKRRHLQDGSGFIVPTRTGSRFLGHGWSHSLSVETSHPRITTVGPCVTCCRSTFLSSSERAGVASNLVQESFANLPSSDYGNFERRRHVASSLRLRGRSTGFEVTSIFFGFSSGGS